MDLEIIKPRANKRRDEKNQTRRNIKSDNFSQILWIPSKFTLASFSQLPSRDDLIWGNFQSLDISTISQFSELILRLASQDAQRPIQIVLFQKRLFSFSFLHQKCTKLKHLIKVRLPPRDFLKYSHKLFLQTNFQNNFLMYTFWSGIAKLSGSQIKS